MLPNLEHSQLGLFQILDKLKKFWYDWYYFVSESLTSGKFPFDLHMMRPPYSEN